MQNETPAEANDDIRGNRLELDKHNRPIPAEALEQMKREGWATMEEQEQYWLDRTEATCDWYDHGLCDMETNAERNL